MQRDTEVEGRLLRHVTTDPLFLAQVLERLLDYEERFGNTGWERPVVDLLGEIQEELADVAGWGVGVAYQLGQSDLLELAGIVVVAAQLWDRTRQLRARLMADQAREAPAAPPAEVDAAGAEVTPLRPDCEWATPAVARPRSA